MSARLETLAWPGSRLSEALEALARRSGLSAKAGSETPNPEASPTGTWIEAAAAWLGLEAEAMVSRFSALEGHLASAGPAILRLPGNGDRFLALLEGSARRLSVLGPDLATRRLSLEILRQALCGPIEAPHVAEVNGLLEEAGVPERRRGRVRDAILREQLSEVRISGCWLLRAAPGARTWRWLTQARFPQRLAALAGSHTVEYLLWILSWWMIGQAALQGRLDRGWLLAWALLLITLVPFRLLTTWLQGVLAVEMGGLLKQRLLYGALRLEPDEIRHQGAGQLLGRALESEAVESLALSGGVLGLVAVIELIVAAAILGQGAGGAGHALLLIAWAVLTLLLAWRYLRRYGLWTDLRLDMTNDLVERMVGHRTRLAQQPRDQWHQGEDQALDRYIDLSSAMDRGAAYLMALVPRGWLVVGLAALAPAFVSNRGSTAELAIALGGLVLAYRALRHLAAGLWQVAGAGIAWRQVAPLFHAAARKETPGSPATALASDGAPRTIVEAHELTYRYRDNGDPVLRGCSLQVQSGDRLLLEGPSGGGKSTLASLLTGLRVPQSGLLLVGGLDRQTLGSEGWRKHVTAAPQFHENHVLTGTFAFNLLMGRRWPPSPADLEEAEALCRDLGLEELLRRMPAGLLQMVGETGWQLSHGERSRLYIARALLQGADLIVLDESFAALDPENLQRALTCVLARARTLLVIAHP